MKNIKCPECGGKMEVQLIKMKYDIKKSHITLKNIPAKVCQKCGNELIDGHTAKDVDLLISRLSEDVERFTKSLAITPEREHCISLAV